MSTPNVFMLTVDSLRYDYFADFQRELADLTDGTEFTNAVSAATLTSSSMPTLATGEFTDFFDTWGIPESGEPKPMAEALANRGYTGGLWSDNYLFGSTYNYDRGFTAGDLGNPTWKKKISNTIRESPASPLFPMAQWVYFNLYQPFTEAIGRSDESFYRSADVLHDAALEWLEREHEQPFCWIHYMDPHHPFEPPQRYLDRYEFNRERGRTELNELTRRLIKDNAKGYDRADIEDVITAYEATVEFTGDELVRFVEQLLERGHFDPERDVLVLTADHGEGLSPERYGMMGHSPPAPWEEMIRVPLMISAPTWDRETIEDQASLINVYDAVLGLVESLSDDAEDADTPTPTDLTCDEARFVTEWEITDQEEGFNTYRGLRDEDGTKIFGAPIDGESRVVLTEYELSETLDEVLFESDGTEEPTDEETAALWTDLHDRAETAGPLVETGSELEGELVEDHLRNLGYIE